MIIFTLADEVIEFDEKVLWSDEAILLEKTTGRRLVDITQAFVEGEMEARVAYFWLARRRTLGADAAGLLSQLRFNVADFRVQEVADTGTAPDPSTPATTDESAAGTAEPPAPQPSSKTTTATSARSRSTAGSSPGKSGGSPPKSSTR